MNILNDDIKTPAAAIISCSDLSHDEIVKNIIGTDCLPEKLTIAENVMGYPWHIETKYYIADINLVTLKDKNLVSSDFANSIEAVMIHFNNEKIESFEFVKTWLPFLEEFNPQVRLLACDNCSSDIVAGLKREQIITWCLDNGFELVELKPDETEDDEIEDDFQETKSYKRIIQAFHANLWGNLIMKDHPTFSSSDVISQSKQQDPPSSKQDLENMSNLLAGVSTTGRKVASGSKTEDNISTEKIDSLLDEDKWLFDAVGQEDPGGTSFESLFSKLLNLKEKAASLTGDERKLYAEKVAIEFWRALGGDEDEVAGLSDEEN